MILNESNLAIAFDGFKATFNAAFAAGPAHWEKVAMVVPSSARDEAYGRRGQFPKLRERVGPRVVSDIRAHGFAIVNKTCESTLGIRRETSPTTATASWGRCSPRWATRRRPIPTSSCSRS